MIKVVKRLRALVSTIVMTCKELRNKVLPGRFIRYNYIYTIFFLLAIWLFLYPLALNIRKIYLNFY